MCHVMKKLLVNIGVHPTVIELDDHEISALPPSPPPSDHDSEAPRSLAPALFIGGTCVGGLESLVALHLSGHLVPKLVEVGALVISSKQHVGVLNILFEWLKFGKRLDGIILGMSQSLA
ncbi:hypothetical protein GH714_037078 [Hevea brasiliensis]|uniref:Uncharacterized protein n=1 Tax=Hevea brasiliensis TaxID=3981 RepID=A0A6A6KG33_HEVBR|nr:hypothetical protein GH714_037078 [Hevea brasiliensis]